MLGQGIRRCAKKLCLLARVQVWGSGWVLGVLCYELEQSHHLSVPWFPKPRKEVMISILLASLTCTLKASGVGRYNSAPLALLTYATLTPRAAS